MNLRTKSQFPVSPKAIKIPRTTAPPSMSKRHERPTDTRLINSGKVSGCGQVVADPGSRVRRARPRRLANRNAKLPFPPKEDGRARENSQEESHFGVENRPKDIEICDGLEPKQIDQKA